MIAQVMHLHNLRELSEAYEIAALCDVSEPVARGCADRYGVPVVHTSWQDLVAERLDVVMVLTSGSHAPVAVAAAQAGSHVFVEKPMCLSVAEGSQMLQAARAAGVRLMVGTMKRYDPAYERRLAAALPEGDGEARYCYRWMLLDNLVHELNMLRGVLGEPDRVHQARLGRTVCDISLRFGPTEVHLSWVDLPGLAHYKQELAFYALKRRVTLTLPSPYMRGMPSLLTVEGGEAGTAHSTSTVEVVSYEEAFKRELIELNAAIGSGRDPRTDAVDGLHDVALCEAIARSHITGAPVDLRSALPAWALDGAAAAVGVGGAA